MVFVRREKHAMNNIAKILLHRNPGNRSVNASTPSWTTDGQDSFLVGGEWESSEDLGELRTPKVLHIPTGVDRAYGFKMT